MLVTTSPEVFKELATDVIYVCVPFPSVSFLRAMHSTKFNNNFADIVWILYGSDGSCILRENRYTTLDSCPRDSSVLT